MLAALSRPGVRLDPAPPRRGRGPAAFAPRALLGPMIAALVSTGSACVPPELSNSASSGGSPTTSPAGGGGAGGAAGTTGGAGAATGGGAGTTGGTGGGGTGGTGTPLDECTSPMACVAAAPPGWLHVRSYSAPSGAAATGCPGGEAPLILHRDPHPSECNACLCMWAGAKCSQPELSCYYGNSACAGAPAFSLLPTNSSCQGPAAIPENMADTSSCQITKAPTVLASGMCVPLTPMQVQPALWAVDVHVCGVKTSPSADCDEGACAAGGGGQYTGAVCVMKTGNELCPSGWPSKTLVYEEGQDGRACGSCACGAPSTTCSSGTYLVFDDSVCAGTVATVTTLCTLTGNKLSDGTRSIKPPIITASTTSTCTGGEPTGQVVPIGPRTICCQ